MPKLFTNRLQFLLYLEWGILTLAAIAIFLAPHSWRDLLWFGITMLLLAQLFVLARRASKGEYSSPRQPAQPEELAALRAQHQIAYDRYDSLAHSLTALNIQLQTALKFWETNPTQAQSFLTIAYQLGVSMMQEMRKSISMLQGTAKDSTLH